MELSKLQIDPEKDKKGRWCKFEDAEFLIAAHMNPTHRNVLSKLARQHRSSARDDAKSEEMSNLALARGVLLDWKGMTLEGKPFPYNEANAVILLSSSRPLKDFIIEQATEWSAYVKEGETADAVALKSGS